MSWAPQPPGSWPYLELANQRVDELRAAAERDHLAREARQARARRARRWLRQPIDVAGRVNHLLGWIISPSRPSLRH